MWYPPVVTAPAASEPVTRAAAKTWGQFDTTADDDRIDAALAAQRSFVESYTGTLLVEQTVEIKCDSFCDFANLPLAPVQSVEVTYLDTDGAEQTLDESIYELRAEGLQTSIVHAYGAYWPTIRPGSRITVTAVCGYETVPPAILQAIRLLTVADLDGGRDQIMETVWALLANHRRFL